MQFQVPQYIEAEDKIIGPLSLRQFAYIGAGGALSAALYFTVQTWLWAIGSFFIFAIAIAFAFIKIEGRPFINVVLSAFNFYWKPQTYVWKPAHQTVALPEKKAAAEAGRSALEDILAKSAAKTKYVAPAYVSHSPVKAEPEATPEIVAKIEPRTEPQPKPLTRETVKESSALHKSWEDVQTGASFSKKNSDKQFLEKKMSERYEIFHRISGDRNAAKRIDYR